MPRNKFDFIETIEEYRRFENFYDLEISAMQALPETPERMEYYTACIVNRDELFQRGIVLLASPDGCAQETYRMAPIVYRTGPK